jgi:hypothetical protein
MMFLRPFLAWFAIGLVGLLALAASVDLATFRALPDAPDVPDAVLRLLLVAQPAMLMGIGIALGVALSDGVGLTSYLTARVRGQAAALPDLVLPLSLGLIGGMLVAFGDLMFFSARGETGDMATPGVLQAVAALTYGGIVEELMLRYGLLTLLFWGAWKLRGRVPGPFLGWGLVVVVAILFGAGHLPAMAAAVELDAGLVIRTIFLNAVLGVLYGWFYWRRGLEAAMVAHMATHPGMWLISLVL